MKCTGYCKLVCLANCSYGTRVKTERSIITCREFYKIESVCIQCPEHCKSCSSTTNCLQCNPGYKGNTCEEKCSNCKEGTKCKQDTGYCEDSCKVGKSGDSCDIDCNSTCMSCARYDKNNCTACADDRYGTACNNECPSKCLNGTCNETDGICTDGCTTGFWGQKCENSCSVYCNTCDRNGTCLECVNGYSGYNCSKGQNQTPSILGVVFGVLGLLFLLVFVVIICRKRDVRNWILACINQGSIESEVNDYEEMEPINNTSSGAPFRSKIANTTGGDNAKGKLLESSHEIHEVSNSSTVVHDKVNGHRDTEHVENHNQDENLRTSPTGSIESEVNDYEEMEPITNTSSGAPFRSQIVNTTGGDNAKGKLLESSYKIQVVSNSSTVVHDKVNGHRDTENVENHNQDENLRTSPTDDDSQAAANNYITDSNVINSIDIKGMDGKSMEYIASFGSLKDLTTNGFLWKKVFQTKCSAIVMLITPAESEEFGIYVRTCASTEKKQGEFTIIYNGQISDKRSFIVRSLILCKHESDTKQETRNIVLSVFVWPTVWQPLHKTRFSDCHKITTNERRKLNECGPSIVFSSDGVHRCGTYIAFDIWKSENTNVTTDSIRNCIDHLKNYGVEINNENKLRELCSTAEQLQPKHSQFTC